jgi:hypothetical protein
MFFGGGVVAVIFVVVVNVWSRFFVVVFFVNVVAVVWWGHNHLLEIRLLETAFLSRFQPNPKLRCLVLDNFQKKYF